MAANNRWNSPQGNFHASNRGQHPHASHKTFTCRWCNQSFMSSEDLIIHIDSHIERGDVGMRRWCQLRQHIMSERGHFPNQLQPNIPVSMPMQEARNFADNRMFSPPQQPAAMHPTTRNTSPCVGRLASLPEMYQFQSTQPKSNAMMIPNLLDSCFHMEESPVGGTMPYINLLERPFKGIEVINLDDDEDTNPDPKAVDLSLTL